MAFPGDEQSSGRPELTGGVEHERLRSRCKRATAAMTALACANSAADVAEAVQELVAGEPGRACVLEAQGEGRVRRVRAHGSVALLDGLESLPPLEALEVARAGAALAQVGIAALWRTSERVLLPVHGGGTDLWHGLEEAGAESVVLLRFDAREGRLGGTLIVSERAGDLGPDDLLWLAPLAQAAAGALALLRTRAELGRMQNRFRQLGHDLRTPLTPIAAALRMLRRDPGLQGTAERLVSTIDRALLSMVRLIDGMSQGAGHPSEGGAGGVASTPNDVAKLPTEPVRILLVDDHEDTLTLTRMLLERRGYSVETASDALSALTRARAQTFDLLITDIVLPDESGVELMRQVAAERPPIVGIALSGYGAQTDIERSREAGFAEHFTKPLDIQLLESAIRRHVPRAQTMDRS